MAGTQDTTNQKSTTSRSRRTAMPASGRIRPEHRLDEARLVGNRSPTRRYRCRRWRPEATSACARENDGDADLQARAGRTRSQGWSEAYAFFKHEDDGTAPTFAQRFMELGGQIAAGPPMLMADSNRAPSTRRFGHAAAPLPSDAGCPRLRPRATNGSPGPPRRATRPATSP
jgi:hypothetical protein